MTFHSTLFSKTFPFHPLPSSSNAPSTTTITTLSPLSFQSHPNSTPSSKMRFTTTISSLGLEEKQPFPPLNPPTQGLKKKKRPNDALAMLDISDDAVSLKPQHQQQLRNHNNKAKHVWVLLLDLFVCVVPFVLWLWVCSNFIFFWFRFCPFFLSLEVGICFFLFFFLILFYPHLITVKVDTL